MEATERRQWWTAEGSRVAGEPAAGGLTITCHCGQTLTLDAGRRCECPVCGRLWVVSAVPKPRALGAVAQQL